MRPAADPVPTAHRWPRFVALLAVPVVALAACSADGVDVSEPLGATASEVGERAQRTVEQLEEAGLGTLASAVRQVDMDEVVAEGEFTLFAPDDEAFQSLTADELANLTSDTERVVSMLRDHVVEDAIPAEDLEAMAEVTTVGGTTLEVSVEDGRVRVGDGEVLQTLQLEQGVVLHVTDALLVRE